MRRRRLLAAVGTAALVPVAGCGYAHGGGDVRRRERVDVGLGPRGPTFRLAGDRIVVVDSGRHYVLRDGDPEWVDGARVAVADREGSSRWSYLHRSPARSVAVGGSVYLLDEASRVVAVGPTDVERTGSTEVDGEERWRASVDDAEPSLSADDRGAYVALAGGVAAVRDGTVAWRRELPAPVEELWSLGGGVLARTEGPLLALDADGAERWRRTVESRARVTVAADRAVVVGDDLLGVAPDGTVEWRYDWDRGTRGLTVTDGRVGVADSAGIRALDAADGTRLWRLSPSMGLTTPVVGPGTLYDVVDCRAVALDDSGRRWTRDLDDGGRCRAVTGWLEDEAVAFLLESGDVVWLQRTDQDRGLL